MRRFLRTAAVIGLTALTVGFVAGNRPATAAASTVTGTVYQDYNLNASRDLVKAQGVAYDRGLGGITVTAYDLQGTPVGTATTATDGTYTLNVTNSASTAIRVEFSWPDSGATAGLKPSFNGTGSATTVQFVNVGATSVNLGLNVPGDYCQNNPSLVTCYVGMGPGSTDAKTGAQVFSTNMPTIKQSDYSSTSPAWNPYTGIANSDHLGAVFGIGVDRTHNAYFGTYVRRHIDYGDAGAVNAIYRVNTDNPNIVTTFVTLPGTLPAHSSADISSCCTGVQYTDDKAVFDKVGRIGLGDVDVSPDGKTLYAVDMNEAAPKFYSVPINGSGNSVTAGTPSSINIPAPTTYNGVPCVGTWHPMGIGLRGSRILVGGVCGAETTVTPSLLRGPAVTQAAAFVLELSGSTFSPILAFSLGYDRTCAETSDSAGEPCASTTSDTSTRMGGDWTAWNPYPTLVDWWGGLQLHSADPQPMLANIEIADNGDLILGMRDRYTDMQKYDSAAYTYEFDDSIPGAVQYWDRSAGGVLTTFTYGAKAAQPMSVGDILRVCNNSGTLALESNGTCAGSIGSGNTNANNVKEFYFDNLSRGWHSETTTGSLATMAGYSGVWSTTIDPNDWNQQGVLSLGECAAAATPANCYPTAGLNANNVGSKIGGQLFDDVSGFAKGNALADLELMCDSAPVQIGNRVWIDIDRDGIQDPTEVAVAGVTVHLYAADGTTLLGTAITNANGEYYFDSTVTEAAAGDGNNVGGGLAAGAAYVIRLDKASDYTSGGPLYGYTLTSTTSTDPSTLQDTSVDNNASTVRSYPQITTQSIVAGVNDHTFDVGFYNASVAAPTSMIAPVGMGNYVWVDTNKDGIQGPTEKPLAGVVVTLYNTDGTPAKNIDGGAATATTNAAGYYFIDNLVSGDYYAVFTLPDGYVFTTQSSSGSTSANDSNPAVATGKTPVFTIGRTTTGDTVADTDSSTKALWVNPTIDAGVVPKAGVSVGNLVWRDLNGDGLQGPADRGVKGAVVRIYNLDGTPVTDINGKAVKAQTTGKDGKYLFTNLPAGQYKVSITYPGGWMPTTPNRSNRGLNSSSFSTKSRALASGESDLTLDFGMVRNTAGRLPATR